MDYLKPGWPDQIRTAVGKIDVVFEVAAATSAVRRSRCSVERAHAEPWFAYGEPSGIDQQAAAERGADQIGMPMVAESGGRFVAGA
ncbi:hypothetical protein [Nonomuraea lactucae]|uniref:hypothetical protein n=1 Tax=Nonomuraea lactucae TaxID=2249762 RepID=UPI0013B41B76|nr:hypothetical protein [Nonomuraea lactucae]